MSKPGKGMCTFLLRGGGRIDLRADSVKTVTEGGCLVSYEVSGLYDTRPLYIRIENVDAVLWTPDGDAQ